MASAAREDTGWRAKVGGWGALWSTALGRAGHGLACVSSNTSGAAAEPQSTDKGVEWGEVGWGGVGHCSAPILSPTSLFWNQHG